jgi:hypothetical protein
MHCDSQECGGNRLTDCWGSLYELESVKRCFRTMPARRKLPKMRESAAAVGGGGGGEAVDKAANNMDAAADRHDGHIHSPPSGSGGSLPASWRCSVRFAKEDGVIMEGDVRSENVAKSHGGNVDEISIYAQDKSVRRQRPSGVGKRSPSVGMRVQQSKRSTAITRRLAITNLALRVIEADVGKEHADSSGR